MTLPELTVGLLIAVVVLLVGTLAAVPWLAEEAARSALHDTARRHYSSWLAWSRSAGTNTWVPGTSSTTKASKTRETSPTVGRLTSGVPGTKFDFGLLYRQARGNHGA